MPQYTPYGPGLQNRDCWMGERGNTPEMLRLLSSWVLASPSCRHSFALRLPFEESLFVFQSLPSSVPEGHVCRVSPARVALSQPGTNAMVPAELQ